MRQTGTRARAFAAPLKAHGQRFAFILLVMMAAGLLIMGKVDAVLLERGRTAVTDMTAPVMAVLAEPVGAFRDLSAEIRTLSNLHAENARLEAENQRLLGWVAAARQFEQENRALRSLLQMRPEPASRFLSARIIADTGGPFVRTVLVDAGTRHGVTGGQIAMAPGGVIGRVTSAGPRSARVLLLTDLNSRLPVQLQATRERAILTGDNTDRPRLSFLPQAARVHPGDVVVTSGHGGLFPPGLPVGRVETVGGGEPRVRLWTDGRPAELLTILDYMSADAAPPETASADLPGFPPPVPMPEPVPLAPSPEISDLIVRAAPRGPMTPVPTDPSTPVGGPLGGSARPAAPEVAQ